MKTAIICVLKSGGDFHPIDVIRLKGMLEKNITMPYDFYCLTDTGRSIVDMVSTGADVLRFFALPLRFDYSGWWSKVELFRKDLVDADRIIYFDLDTIILDNIDDLLMQDFDFIGLRPFNPIRSRWENYVASAIMSWRNDGSFNFLFDQFNYEKHSRKFPGDQDYLSFMLKQVGKSYVHWQNVVDGIYSYKRHVKRFGLKETARIICFHGSPRPNQVDAKWIKEAWYAA